MKLQWTKHGIERGCTRLGRYGMPEIEKRIIQNLNNAVETKCGRAKVRFKLGRKRCVAILEPLDDEGVQALVVTTYHAQKSSTCDFGKSKRLKKHDKKLRRLVG